MLRRAIMGHGAVSPRGTEPQFLVLNSSIWGFLYLNSIVIQYIVFPQGFEWHKYKILIFSQPVNSWWNTLRLILA